MSYIMTHFQFQTNPISPAGEVLRFPVGQNDENEPDYKELIDDDN